MEDARLLLADEDATFRETAAGILAKRGFAVTEAGSGEEAIEQARGGGFDVAVLGVKMPGMSGDEALAELKKIDKLLPVIMLTGHGTPESALHALKNGVFDYLVKPCAIDLLARKIHDAAAGRRGLAAEEPRARDIMTPLTSFSTIGAEGTAGEAVYEILESFTRTMTTATVHETVHRSILVIGEDDRVVGIITFTDILNALQPPYMRVLTEAPPMRDSILLEPSNFSGMFTVMARDLARKTVREIMSEAPPFIDGGANLMEAAGRLLNQGLRRLLVKEGDEVVGVLREQDLFFELANIIKHYKTLR